MSMKKGRTKVHLVNGKQMTVTMSKPQRDKLEELAEATGTTRNAIMHYAIDAYYEWMFYGHRRPSK